MHVKRRNSPSVSALRTASFFFSFNSSNSRSEAELFIFRFASFFTVVSSFTELSISLNADVLFALAASNASLALLKAVPASLNALSARSREDFNPSMP